MRRWLVSSSLALGVAISPILASAQTNPPDLSGLWDGAGNSQNLIQAMKAQGKEIPLTPYAAEQYKKVDMAKNPNGFCLPPGPSRAITGPSPFQIVQSPDTVAILFDNQFIYPLLSTNGTRQPADIDEYTYSLENSLGKWEGEKLVVQTVAT